jgi:hypothetical protein
MKQVAMGWTCDIRGLQRRHHETMFCDCSTCGSDPHCIAGMSDLCKCT